MNKPKVIVLCGSSKFCQIMTVCAWLLERDEGAITMGLHLLPEWYSPNLPDSHLAEHEGVADKITDLHMRKIDMADEIFVVNYKDYIGKHTKNQRAYAQEKGIPVRWFQNDDIGGKVKEILIAALNRQVYT